MAAEKTFRGYGPEQGYDFLRRADRRARLPAARRGSRRGRDLHQRRRQVRHRQYPGDLRPGQHRRRDRPGLPGLRRQQRHGRPDREAGTGRAFRRSGLPALHRSNGLKPRLPQDQGGSDLPLLPQQPHRDDPDQGRAEAVGRLRPGQPGAHPLRRRLRGLYHESRTSRTASTRSRAPRRWPSSSAASPRPPASPAPAAPSPWCPKTVTGLCRRRQRPRTAPALAPTPDHQVQRGLLPGPGRGRRRLHPGGPEADPGGHRLLHGQRRV